MSPNMTIERLREMQGHPVMDAEGKNIGNVEAIYIDKETKLPEWIGLKAGGKNVVVPCETAEIQGGGIKVPYKMEMVKSSGEVSGKEITEQQEGKLYQSYGIQRSESKSSTGLPGGQASGGQHHPADKSEASVTLHEEQLKVGKSMKDAGSARLTKVVETTPVSQEVELKKDTATVQRTPVNKPAQSSDFGEQSAKLNLHQEEPMVSKEAMATEEVKMSKQSETSKQKVTGDVRKERAEIENAKEQ